MLRRIIAAFLLIAFSMQVFSKAVIAINFYANQKEIAQALCENRNKPKMNCCGKCQLQKKLKEDDKNNGQGTAGHKNVNTEIFPPCHLVIDWPTYFKQPVSNTVLNSSALPPDRAFAIFHPPSC
jgi:hypothetical protein